MGVKWPHRLRSTELLGLGCLWRGDGPGSSYLLGIHTATESSGAGDSRSPFNSAEFKVSLGQFRPWRPRPNFLNLPNHQPSSLPPRHATHHPIPPLTTLPFCLTLAQPPAVQTRSLYPARQAISVNPGGQARQQNHTGTGTGRRCVTIKVCKVLGQQPREELAHRRDIWATEALSSHADDEQGTYMDERGVW